MTTIKEQTIELLNSLIRVNGITRIIIEYAIRSPKQIYEENQNELRAKRYNINTMKCINCDRESLRFFTTDNNSGIIQIESFPGFSNFSGLCIDCIVLIASD